MGVQKNIGFQEYPKQSDDLGKRVVVCFRYDTDNLVHGTVIRDDREEPWEMIIKLDDGRIILSTECQYSFP